MPSPTSLHSQSAIRPAIAAMGSVSKLAETASPLAIGAMNWAAWEYRTACFRRLEIWRMAAGNKVPGSRRPIYDTRQPRKRLGFKGFNVDPTGYLQDCKYTYGGAISGRMGSGKVTATQIMVQQQQLMARLAPLHEVINEVMSHQIDALVYGTLLHGTLIKKKPPAPRWVVHDEVHWWFRYGEVEAPQYYERATRWQSNLTASVPLLSDMLSPEQSTSRSDGNKSKRGWLSKTQRRSMAWLPTPGTRPTLRPCKPAPAMSSKPRVPRVRTGHRLTHGLALISPPSHVVFR